MKVYHGSLEVVEHPIILQPNRKLDYGAGFYTTTSEKQAKEWVERRMLEKQAECGYVNIYEFDERILTNNSHGLKIKCFKEYDEEWANFIFENRNNVNSNVPVHDYDIVYGPIANDRVGLQIRNYMEHNIDLATFLDRLKYMKGITFQYFFGTERAIKLLKRV